MSLTKETIPIIPQWSFSKVQVFEQCKFRAYLQYGLKIPEPERPLPPGKTEHANDRGSRIHDAAEHYVDGTGPFIPELAKFETEFDILKRQHALGKVSLEGEWAHDRDWTPVEWRAKDAWLRLKLDAMLFLNPHEAVVIDYKSGKKFGNEIKHADQLMLYQLVAFLRYPDLEVIHAELWYLDVDEVTSVTFRRSQGIRFKRKYEQRGLAMTDATDFPTNSNIYSCLWCPYSTKVGGTGHCTKGYVK